MRRFSLGKFMALATLLAADFAWLRVLWSARVAAFGQKPAGGYILEFGLLGMANVLALAVVVGPKRRGFLAAGVAAMLAYCGICLAWGEALRGRARTACSASRSASPRP